MSVTVHLNHTGLLLFINFFLLSFAIMTILIYVYRLRRELQRVQTLQAITQRYHDLFVSTSEGVIRCDEKGRLLSINPAGAAILGIAEADAETTAITSFISPEDILYMQNAFNDDITIRNYRMKITPAAASDIFIDISVHKRDDEEGIVYEGIFHDITEKVNLERELKNHQTNLENLVKVKTKKIVEVTKKHELDLKRLSTRLEHQLENQRRSIARNLHDNLGQVLAAIQINFKIIEEITEPAADPSLAEKIEDSQRLIHQVLDEIHETALDLRPTVLDELGLIPALEWYFARFTQRTDIPVDFKNLTSRESFTATIDTHLYRISQEALTNVLKHADASNVTITLTMTAGDIVCDIFDNGKGFDTAAHLSGDQLGLIGIRERVESMEGLFTIDSLPTRNGAHLTVKIPLKETS